MTNDYKANLMKWLTGNYTPEAQPSEYVNQTISSFQNSNVLKDFLTSHYTTTNVFVRKTIKSNLTGNLVVLAYDNDNSRSIIIIFDETLNPIQLITSYASGTQFKDIMGIGAGEDGNFFLIENTGVNIRFVMCNNIAAPDTTGTYKVVLRKSYNVSGDIADLFVVYEIVKYPGMSKYLVLGARTSGTIDIATEIVVNVGIPNEYNDFTFNLGYSGGLSYEDIYYTLDGENIKFCIGASGGTAEYGYCELKNTDYTINMSYYNMGTPSVRAVNVGYTEAYLIAYDWNTYKYNFYHFVNGTSTLVGSYQTNSGTIIPRITAWSIDKINDVVYGIILGDWDNDNYMIIGYTIINDNFVISSLSEGIGQTLLYLNMIMTATNNYDLYNFFYAFGDLTIKSNLVYNESRYNGTAYNGLTYFKPSYAKFLSNNKIVFARGLYNFTILNDSSTAVVNIPNQYINDLQFTSSLFGETGGKLINDTTNYEKNIYENVLVNFNNAINITNDDIYKQTPSIRLNNSVLTDLDYTQAKIGYVRIMFESGNRDIVPTITQVSDTEYTVDFTLYAGEDINGIQILSQDKQTIYDTFKMDYILNTCYNITRKVEII